MQAEDIIQRKEWAQLTKAERNEVAPLAATEGEYNMLKKMLLIAQEDADDVPMLSASVRENLHQHLKRPSTKGRMVFWYAAAASIIAAIAVIFLLPTQTPTHVAIEPVITPKKEVVLDTTNKQSSPVNPPIEEQQKLVKQNNKPSENDNRNIKNDANTAVFAAVNTSVNANPELMDFVTEVY